MTSDGLPLPHGGVLVDRVLRGDHRQDALARLAGAPRLTVTARTVSDLELIAVGVMSPLTGFMRPEDYRCVVDTMRLQSGLVWTLPITLAVSRAEAEGLREGQEIALVAPPTVELEDPTHGVVALLRLQEKFAYDRAREARVVFRTTDPAHPGVAALFAQGEVLLGGEIWLVNRPVHRQFVEFHHDPAQTRRLFAGRGWSTVVGFQTRNPIHRSHEYIQKTALELVDGLFLHPLVGETKGDDIPADVRMASYQALLRDYYPPDRVILGIFPATMRYAGPREAIFHALCRKNYGCSHFIVGRDHAGVGKFYGPYDGQKIFDQFASEEIGIRPMFFDNTFFCRKCGGVVSGKTCPHDPSHHVVLSGTQVRQMLERGENLPEEFTRPEVARVLMDGLRERRTFATSKGQSNGKRRRVLVIGLDCAEPSLVFDQWREDLPNLQRLMETGTYGSLESIIPCITVPAWASMMSSKDPGQLGIYGFHNRVDTSYSRMAIANSTSVREPQVWDYLSQAGKSVVLIGVPPAYPPRPVNGISVGCFLTPSTERAERPYTYPASVAGELEQLVGTYLVDVANFRTEDKDSLVRQIHEMTEKRFTVIKSFLRSKPWDFFMSVEIGVDRMHHGMWKYHDPLHPKHVPGNPYRETIREYYRSVDRQIGEVLELIDDDTVVWVVSDHGAKRMEGGICINEWLVREGFLVLKDQPTSLTPLEKCEVDWTRTRAWGGGGYYGRIFLNVAGREPSGIVPPGGYEELRDELAAKLKALPGPAGEPLETTAYRPQRIYREIRGVPPDLIVYFGDLYWRAVGSIGVGDIYSFENDTGPDDANHAQFGLFICSDPQQRGRGRIEGARIGDVAPTVLHQLHQPVPQDMGGRVLEFASDGVKV